MDLFSSGCSRGSYSRSDERKKDHANESSPLNQDEIDKAHRILEENAFVCLLLANASFGPDKNLCFVNAIIQFLRTSCLFR